MTSQEQLSSFIQSIFRSIWQLELLLALKRDPGFRSHDELVTALRASDLIVSQGLAALAAAGLIVTDEEERAAYGPVSKGDARLVEEVEALYARSPDAVRRLIVGSPSGLSAFADAFRLRRD
ncbi:MAG: hypothetical protein ABIW83_04360 [Allosphingosinicella sp.]